VIECSSTSGLRTKTTVSDLLSQLNAAPIRHALRPPPPAHEHRSGARRARGRGGAGRGGWAEVPGAVGRRRVASVNKCGFAPGGDVPDAERVVEAGGADERATRREGHAEQRLVVRDFLRARDSRVSRSAPFPLVSVALLRIPRPASAGPALPERVRTRLARACALARVGHGATCSIAPDAPLHTRTVLSMPPAHTRHAAPPLGPGAAAQHVAASACPRSGGQASASGGPAAGRRLSSSRCARGA
jgi:hypothetical protein